MKKDKPHLSPNRVVVVDALRGFAVMAIMLLHFIEHFIYGVYPPNSSPLMTSIDQSVWDGLFFMFAGKSYSIFALLFGFTFAIQYRNQQAKGYDFAGRFAWRMFLLLAFGTLNAAFFPGGDVLVLFALMGLILIPLRKISTKWLVIIACIFLIQPIEIYHTICAVINPNYVVPKLLTDSYYPALTATVGNGNFFEMIGVNATKGQLASLLWAIDAGRLMQAPGLFIIGLLLGRCNYFSFSTRNRIFWVNTLLVGIVLSFVLYVAKSAMPIPSTLTTIFTMWYNVAFTAIWVAGFVLLYYTSTFRTITNGFTYYGRMSLTNYVSQSIIGSILFFPYAFGLAAHVGIAGSFVMGILVLILQIKFCKWWLHRHKLGMLEWVWHKATWINYKNTAK